MHLTLFSVLLVSPLISGKIFMCPNKRLWELPAPECNFNETFPDASSLSVACIMTDVDCSEGFNFEISKGGEDFNETEKYCGPIFETFKTTIDSNTFLARVTTSKRIFHNLFFVTCCVKPETGNTTTTTAETTTEATEPTTTTDASTTTTTIDPDETTL